jgi:hypothetical protein
VDRAKKYYYIISIHRALSEDKRQYEQDKYNFIKYTIKM